MINKEYIEIKKYIFESHKHHENLREPYVDSLELEKFIDKLYNDNYDIKKESIKIDKRTWYEDNVK